MVVQQANALDNRRGALDVNTAPTTVDVAALNGKAFKGGVHALDKKASIVWINGVSNVNDRQLGVDVAAIRIKLEIPVAITAQQADRLIDANPAFRVSPLGDMDGIAGGDRFHPFLDGSAGLGRNRAVVFAVTPAGVDVAVTGDGVGDDGISRHDRQRRPRS